jgi:hypothetical protein
LFPNNPSCAGSVFGVTVEAQKLIVQNNTEKRAVDFQAAVVVNKSQFPESVHEKTHSRAGRADHFR